MTDGSGVNPWVTKTTEVAYDNAWIQVSHRDVVTPTGTDGIYGLVHFKNLAIGIIPIDDEDHTWLVGQYRYAVDHYSWEIPAGGGDLNEDPIEGARRELAEECGLVADNYSLLVHFETSNSVCDEKAFIYVATGLTPCDVAPDDTEVLELRRLPVGEAIDMVLRGEIVDSLTAIGLMRLALRRQR